MKTYDRILGSVGIASLAALALSFSTGAYAVAGKFQFVNGEVQVIDAAGKQRLAQKGGAIDEGETVSSTGNGFAQIRMEDGGFFAVRPDTQFKIDTFKYEGKEDGSEKGIFSLIKGSLRSVTGVVGKKHKDNYKINTATATIGIRGSGADVGHNNSIGTAVHTLFGGHSLTSGGRTIVTGPGQTALAPPGQEPRFVPDFPFNSGTGANGQNQGGNDQPAGGTPEKKAENTEGNNPPAPPTPEQKVIIPVKTSDGELNFTQPTIATSMPGSVGSGRAAVMFFDDDGNYVQHAFDTVGTWDMGEGYTVDFSSTINASGALTGWRRQYSNGSGNTSTQVASLGAAQLFVDGTDASLGVVWGRWGGGYTLAFSETYNGETWSDSYNPPGGLAFATGSHITTITELNALQANNMVGTYTLVPGSFPTLVNGVASGALTSGSAVVNFTSMHISSFQVAGSGGAFGTWSASGSGSIQSFMSEGIGLSGTSSVHGGIGGDAVGGFVGNQAQGLISTIGLSGGGSVLSGAAVMKGTLSAGSPPMRD
jgi:hypothetical protein